MSRKKETKCVMCNISYKNWLILVKFGTPFPEQICCKMVETFSTLPEYCLYTTLWNLKCSLRTCYCWLLQNGSMSDELSSFTRQCWDIIQVTWKTFISFCSKFIQETAYQILLKSPEFCHIKHFGLFFWRHCIATAESINSSATQSKTSNNMWLS